MVSVEHLYKSIGKNEILHDISFTIGDHAIVGLLGPNGAGKSTLMKCMTGLWTFQQGKISVCGITAEHQLPHDVTRKTGYLPENNPLYADMYVREYLLFMAQMQQLPHKNRKQRCEELIEQVGLQAMAHKKIGALSKGYRQRVGLAQALMGNPELLVLDEPTTGLDPNQLDEIRALIRRLGEDRIVILSTHILQEVEAVCNRVIILSEGQVRADSTDLSQLEERFRQLTQVKS